MSLKRQFICIVAMLLSLGLHSSISSAGPEEAYRQALNLAAQGKESMAMASLAAASETLPLEQPWRSRMVAAHTLIQMRQMSETRIEQGSTNPYLLLSKTQISRDAPPEPEPSWPVVVAATLFPGAGHALQGRWSDAKTAALMVWPFLILALWAAKRRMGPVTLFFALITVWLWSGTVFSAISLAERGDVELYMTWWQGLWQASGLPGRPW